MVLRVTFGSGAGVSLRGRLGYLGGADNRVIDCRGRKSGVTDGWLDTAFCEFPQEERKMWCVEAPLEHRNPIPERLIPPRLIASMAGGNDVLAGV